MPAPEQILHGLTLIANDGFVLAISWHVLIAIALCALALGWRPARRTAGVLLGLPALSVAILAFVHGNPFNAAVFAVLSLALIIAGLRLGTMRVRGASGWPLALGAAMIAFGWVYPHFLPDRSPFAYLYGAPVGLVPCPTLSLMIGFALLAGGFSSRPWSLILALAGAFYGVFGAARLGVTIDFALLGGALALVVVLPRKPRSVPPRPAIERMAESDAGSLR